jgi:hypothetical protein
MLGNYELFDKLGEGKSSEYYFYNEEFTTQRTNTNNIMLLKYTKKTRTWICLPMKWKLLPN